MRRFFVRLLLGLGLVLFVASTGLPVTAASRLTFTVVPASVFLRQRPTLSAPRTYSVFHNQSFGITGRTADNAWLRLDFAGATQGTWVLAVLGKVTGDLSQAPVVEVTPVEVPTAAPLGTPAASGAVQTTGTARPVMFTITAGSVYARNAPNQAGARVQSLFRGQKYRVHARSADNQWMQLEYTGATTEVWAQVVFGVTSGDLNSLPTAGVAPAATVASNPPNPPWIPTITPKMREVYLQSASYGRKLNMFTVAGDCNSEPKQYLGRSLDFSKYSWLQPTRDFFASSFPPNHDSLAVHGGFGIKSVIDSSMAPWWCSEGFLACELDQSQASIVFILLGTTNLADWQDFETDYRRIIQVTLDHHALPVVVTKVDGLEWEAAKAPRDYMNNLMRQLAREYEVPLLDLWWAVQGLPNSGLVPPDKLHLSPEAMEVHLVSTLETLAAIRGQP